MEKYSELLDWWYDSVGLAPPLNKGFWEHLQWTLVYEKLLTQHETKNNKNKTEHSKLWSKFNFAHS